MPQVIADKKGQRTTNEQLAVFVAFSRDNPELEASKNSQTNLRVVNDLWEELAEKLNAMKGPTRSVKKWRECLKHWKIQIKSRNRKHQADVLLPDRGPVISHLEPQAYHTYEFAGCDTVPTTSLLHINKVEMQDDSSTSMQSTRSLMQISKVELQENSLSTSIPARADRNGAPPPKKHKTNGPKDPLMEALRALEARDERQMRMLEETNKKLDRIGDGIFALVAAMEKRNAQ